MECEVAHARAIDRDADSLRRVKFFTDALPHRQERCVRDGGEEFRGSWFAGQAGGGGGWETAPSSGLRKASSARRLTSLLTCGA